MSVVRIDHINITVDPGNIVVMRDFYVRALNLQEGMRPNFSFPGYWLYANGQPIVHIAGKPSNSDIKDTGKLHHVALACNDIAETMARLERWQVPYRVRDVPGERLRQIFITDPAGIMLELNFPLGTPRPPQESPEASSD